MASPLDRRTPLHGMPLATCCRGIAWAGSALLLLLPAIAMRFTTEVDRGAGDFVAFAAMLAAACGALELLLRRLVDRWYFAAFVLAAATAFVLLRANLAVGLIGSADRPANALYPAVFGVGAVGALRARLRARGLAWALRATALAQVAVVVVARANWPIGVPRAALGSAGFVALRLASAAGFARSARRA